MSRFFWHGDKHADFGSDMRLSEPLRHQTNRKILAPLFDAEHAALTLQAIEENFLDQNVEILLLLCIEDQLGCCNTMLSLEVIRVADEQKYYAAQLQSNIGRMARLLQSANPTFNVKTKSTVSESIAHALKREALAVEANTILLVDSANPKHKSWIKLTRSTIHALRGSGYQIWHLRLPQTKGSDGSKGISEGM